MNKLQWFGLIGLVLVFLFMLTGCSYNIEWARGEGYTPVVIAQNQ